MEYPEEPKKKKVYLVALYPAHAGCFCGQQHNLSHLSSSTPRPVLSWSAIIPFAPYRNANGWMILFGEVRGNLECSRMRACGDESAYLALTMNIVLGPMLRLRKPVRKAQQGCTLARHWEMLIRFVHLTRRRAVTANVVVQAYSRDRRR